MKKLLSPSLKGTPVKINHIPFEESAERILSQNSSYYNNLTPANKEVFIKRLRAFLADKNFEGRQLVISDEIKVMVAAAAIQLTFGLDDYLLGHFSTIIVYPDIYKSTVSNNFHKGEVNLSGNIVLSWKYFEKGNDASEGINLGLHEMAHALRFNRMSDSSYDEFFDEYFDKWSNSAYSEIERIRQGNSFFRKYGAENINEFFSVCVEVFFENANSFKAYNAELYTETCILLNQDPSQNIYGGNVLRKNIMHDKSFEPRKELMVIKFNYSFFAKWLVFPLFCLVSVYSQDFGLSLFLFMLSCITAIIANYKTMRVVVLEDGIKIQRLLVSPLNRNILLPFNRIISVCIDKQNYYNSYGETDENLFFKVCYMHNKTISYITIDIPDNVEPVLSALRIFKDKGIATKIKSRMILNELKNRKKSVLTPEL